MLEESGKYIFGVCKVNDKGQIVIPKEAREVFGIKQGDSLILLGDKEKGGLALIKTKIIADTVEKIL
jgi:AbrB family looped-hinge helix DNA binding protein